MNYFRQMAKALLTAALPRERWLVHGPRRSPNGKKTFALTFDDGPHPEWTPRVLDALQRWGLTATFFVVGIKVLRFPQIVERIVKEGHCLGNHTYTHSEPRATSTEQFLEEVNHTRNLLFCWTGRPPSCVRPPKGELTWSKLRGLWKAHHTVVLWSVDPRDYRMRDTTEVERFSARYEPQQGDIILLHDHHPAAVELLATWGRRGLFECWNSVSVESWLQPSPPLTATRQAPKEGFSDKHYLSWAGSQRWMLTDGERGSSLLREDSPCRA